MPAGRLHLLPTFLAFVPSGMAHQTAESAGIVVGATLEPGGFVDLELMPFIDRLEAWFELQRGTGQRDVEVSRDLGIFALLPRPASTLSRRLRGGGMSTAMSATARR